MYLKHLEYNKKYEQKQISIWTKIVYVAKINFNNGAKTTRTEIHGVRLVRVTHDSYSSTNAGGETVTITC